MLAKLLKYDLIYIYKNVGIIALIMVLCALLHNLTSYDTEIVQVAIDDAPYAYTEAVPQAPIIVQVLHTIFYNAVIVFLINLIFSASMRTWHRFKTNFYGDEAYLTHTLPVKRSTLWLAKFLDVVIITASIILAIALTFFILNATPTGRGLISFFGISEEMPASQLFVYIFALFMQLIFITLCGLTGIILGYRSAKSHPMLLSIIYGFAIYYFAAMLLVALLYLWGLCDSTILSIFGAPSDITDPASIFNADFVTKILAGGGLAYLVLNLGLYFLDNKVLQKGINLT